MEIPVHVTIWGEANTETPHVVFVHGTMTWGTDEQFGFAAQRTLADHYRLLVMDRRGYGASSDLEHKESTAQSVG